MESLSRQKCIFDQQQWNGNTDWGLSQQVGPQGLKMLLHFLEGEPMHYCGAENNIFVVEHAKIPSYVGGFAVLMVE